MSFSCSETNRGPSRRYQRREGGITCSAIYSLVEVGRPIIIIIQLINNIVIRYNNNMVNQNNSRHANIAITWELLKLTDQQLKLIADSMLFSLDSCDSCDY
jgi:hypothetical protein